jgi:hypothetical protein
MSPHWTTTLLIRRKVFTKTKRRVSQVTQRQKMKLSLERFFPSRARQIPPFSKKASCDLRLTFIAAANLLVGVPVFI